MENLVLDIKESKYRLISVGRKFIRKHKLHKYEDDDLPVASFYISSDKQNMFGYYFAKKGSEILLMIKESGLKLNIW